MFVGCKSDKSGVKIKKIDLHNRIIEAPFIDDSVMHGLAMYYTYKGSLESKITYKNGVKNGLAVNYYPNGSLWDSGYYVNGLKHGHHFVFDSLGSLVYQDYYFNGHRLGGQVFFLNSKLSRYVYSNFEKEQLYEGLYDSVGSIYRYGGEIVNANLYYAKKDDKQGVGIFSYFLNPPNVDIEYSIGLIENNTNKKRELVRFYKSREFIDTIVDLPLPGWYYYVAADYNDTSNSYRKIFLTVLK